MRILLSSFTVLAFTVGASAQNTWFVDPAGSDGNSGTSAGDPFQTINFANSVATPGDVVQLSNDTFGDEQGVIILGDKDLIVVGGGQGLTTLRPHTTLTTNINTSFPIAPVATEQRPVVLIEGSGRVDFRALTIDGNFQVPGNGRLVGLYFRNGADGYIDNCEIKNCRAEPLDGSNAAGVLVRGDSGFNTSDVNLRNCFVHNFGKVAVASFFNSTLEVEETRIVGAGHVSSVAQNGVQISYDSGGAVRRSTICDLFYTPTTYAAAGILGYDALSVVQVEDCNLGNVESGIFVTAITHPFVPVVARRNRVHAANAGCSLFGIQFASIEDNEFHLSTNLNSDAAFDDTSGNTWFNNSYTSYSGVGPYAILGGGGNMDTMPRRGVDMVGGPTSTHPLVVAGHSPVDMVVDDFNGDLLDDFVTVEQNAALSITVGLNNGALGFTQTNTGFAGVTAAPVEIVVGQFSGSSARDVAVLTNNIGSATNQNRVYVFENDGTGSFTQTGMTIILGFSNATGLSANNIDGDAFSDLVVTDSGGGVGSAQLLIADGIGGFSASTLPAIFTKPCVDAAMQRIDTDANADIAVLEGDVSVGRLHLFKGDGAGGFVPYAGSPTTIDPDPTSILASDHDGDFDLDLLTSHGRIANGAVGVFDNISTSSTVVAFRRSRYNVDGSATNLEGGNLGDDNDPDSVFGDAAVVNFNGSSVTVLGSYVAGAGFGGGGIAAAVPGSAPSAVGFGNFNGDKYEDLYYCDGLAGTVVVLEGVAQARADYYGSGCAGTRSRMPYIRPIGNPGATQPNVSHGLEINNCKPFSLSTIIVSATPAPILTPCQLQVSLSTKIFNVILITDVAGEASFGLPIPASPNLTGLKLYCQGGIIDPQGATLFGLGIALTKGLKLRIGD